MNPFHIGLAAGLFIGFLTGLAVAFVCRWLYRRWRPLRYEATLRFNNEFPLMSLPADADATVEVGRGGFLSPEEYTAELRAKCEEYFRRNLERLEREVVGDDVLGMLGALNENTTKGT